MMKVFCIVIFLGLVSGSLSLLKQEGALGSLIEQTLGGSTDPAMAPMTSIIDHLLARTREEENKALALYNKQMASCAADLARMNGEKKDLEDVKIPAEELKRDGFEADIQRLTTELNTIKNTDIVNQRKLCSEKWEEIENVKSDRVKEYDIYKGKVNDIAEVMAVIKELATKALSTTVPLGLVQTEFDDTVKHYFQKNGLIIPAQASFAELDPTDTESILRLKRLFADLLNVLEIYDAELDTADKNAAESFNAIMKGLEDGFLSCHVALSALQEKYADLYAQRAQKIKEKDMAVLAIWTMKDRVELLGYLITARTKECQDLEKAYKEGVERRLEETKTLTEMRTLMTGIKVAQHVIDRMFPVNANVGPAQQVCVKSDGKNPVLLRCPYRMFVENINFASYGKATGDCPVFQYANLCHEPTSSEMVSQACVGRAECTLDPVALFPSAPACAEYLSIIATCSKDVVRPILNPTPVPAPPVP